MGPNLSPQKVLELSAPRNGNKISKGPFLWKFPTPNGMLPNQVCLVTPLQGFSSLLDGGMRIDEKMERQIRRFSLFRM